ncbi:MAG: DUF1624 domain-containing protein, partial [Spirochaetales bacterium]
MATSARRFCQWIIGRFLLSGKKCMTFSCSHRRFESSLRGIDLAEKHMSDNSSIQTTPANRLLSLDVFRGLAIAAMILVNNAGDWGHVFGPLRHARWHGWTMADLVFPSFVFIMGTALPLSLGRRLGEGESRRRVMVSVFRRTIILLLLGFLLNLLPQFDFSTVRVPGVLQRLALCYLLASLVFLGSRRPALWCAAALALMAAHWAVLALVPVPGYGPGVL